MISSAVLALNAVRFTFVVRDDADELVDPTEVTIIVSLDGVVVEPLTVVKDDVGTYHADWDTTGYAEGYYWVVASGTGAAVVGDEIRIKVRAPHTS